MSDKPNFPAHTRKYDLDVLRALAIISVSMNHAVNRTYEILNMHFLNFAPFHYGLRRSKHLRLYSDILVYRYF